MSLPNELAQPPLRSLPLCCFHMDPYSKLSGFWRGKWLQGLAPGHETHQPKGERREQNTVNWLSNCVFPLLVPTLPDPKLEHVPLWKAPATKNQVLFIVFPNETLVLNGDVTLCRPLIGQKRHEISRLSLKTFVAVKVCPKKKKVLLWWKPSPSCWRLKSSRERI